MRVLEAVAVRLVGIEWGYKGMSIPHMVTTSSPQLLISNKAYLVAEAMTGRLSGLAKVLALGAMV